MINRIATQKVLKYELPVEDVVDIQMPFFAKVLCVQVQNGIPHLWVLTVLVFHVFEETP